MTASKEELAVIEAARAMIEANLRQESGSFVSLQPLAQAVIDLNASRAPKKPMSAEERAREVYSALVGPCGERSVAFVQKHIEAAEHAAFDRAVEACERALGESTMGMCISSDHFGEQARFERIQLGALLALKGRCHDAPKSDTP